MSYSGAKATMTPSRWVSIASKDLSLNAIRIDGRRMCSGLTSYAMHLFFQSEPRLREDPSGYGVI
jgi:hypothetical protein